MIALRNMNALKKLALMGIAVCGVAAAVSLPPAASAEPGDGPLIATSCSYEQLMAALQVQAPEASARLADHPEAQAKLRELISLPVDQRRQRVQGYLDRNPDIRAKIEEKRNTPEGQQKVQMLARVADTCHDY